MSKRTGLGKRVRFEVLKRDRFACQYCGQAAPDVLLHVDHIEPVARGGSDDIINLVTACAACNQGKSDIPLDDHSAVVRQRKQAAEIAERLEQFQMMARWHRELSRASRNEIEIVCEEVEQALDVSLTAHGRNEIRKLVRRFSADEVCAAANLATEYLIEASDGSWTQASSDRALEAIPGIAYNRRNPPNEDARERSYVMGIVRNRMKGYDRERLGRALRQAQDHGVDADTIREAAKSADTWHDLEGALIALADEVRQ